MTSLRSLAVEILVRVERDRAFAAPLLAAREGSLAPRDRPLLRTIVRSVLRNRSLLDHVLSRSLSRPLEGLDPDVRAALRAGAAQLLLLDRIPGARCRERDGRGHHDAVGQRRGARQRRPPPRDPGGEAAADRPAERDRSGRAARARDLAPRVARAALDRGPRARRGRGGAPRRRRRRAGRRPSRPAGRGRGTAPRTPPRGRPRGGAVSVGAPGPHALLVRGGEPPGHRVGAARRRRRRGAGDVRARRGGGRRRRPGGRAGRKDANPSRPRKGETRRRPRAQPDAIATPRRRPSRVRAPGRGARRPRRFRRGRRCRARRFAPSFSTPPARGRGRSGRTRRFAGASRRTTSRRSPACSRRFSTPRSTSAPPAGASSTSPAPWSRKRTKGSSRPSCPLARTRRRSAPAATGSPRRFGRPCGRTGSSGSLRAPQTTVSRPSSSERAEGAAEYAAFPLTRCGRNPTFQPFEQT